MRIRTLIKTGATENTTEQTDQALDPETMGVLAGIEMNVLGGTADRWMSSAALRPVIGAYVVTIAVLIVSCIGAIQEYSQYAPKSPAPGTLLFISAWIASTLAVLTVWMRKLR